MKGALLRSLLLLVASLAPSVALALPETQTGALTRGGTFIVASDPTASTAAIDLWFRAPADGYAASVPGVARVAAAAAAAAKLATGRTLAETVVQAGGTLSIEVYPDVVDVGAVVPAASARSVLATLTAAYFVPAIDAATLQAGQRDTVVQSVERQYEADAIAQDVLFGKLFASGPASRPPIPASASEVSQIKLDDVTSFAQRAFRAGNAILTMAGAVDRGMLGAVGDGTGPAGTDEPFDSTLSGQISPTTAQGEEAGLGLAWIGPSISDKKAATALDFVADYLFDGTSGAVVSALRRSGTGGLVRGQFITLHGSGVLLVTLEGSSDAAIADRIVQAVNALRQPLDIATFTAARESFIYHVTSETQTPEEQADMLGWYAAEGDAGYAPGGGEYESIARSLDAQFVADTVRRYLSNPATVRIVMPAHQGSST